ncbi:alpha/beta hydrolase [Granulicella mallensis]|uniref:Sigma-B regulation protein RsbQ n=1 Tax=Granulicella mallensis TaxID=940614 RepID=A0A7W8E853_9BACT|nr:alpha/beta hydrolase [Granulicella mallensis]MBB5062477.1 sigma-B regulation protein RsbQ [Granulicella mallensis]
MIRRVCLLQPQKVHLMHYHRESVGLVRSLFSQRSKGFMSSVLRNNVKISGSGPTTMMFAHGYGCDQNMWRGVVPSFENDHKIVLFDYVGSGDSDPAAFNRTRYSTLNGYAADVIEIIDELSLGPVIFVGHSVSSMIGALAAIKRPELFESIVMIGPSPSYINDGEYVGGFERADIEDLLEMLDNNHSGWSAMMAPIIMGNPEHPEFAQELEQSFCKTDPIHAQHFARVTFLSDNRSDLNKLRTKTLILQCDKDAIAPAIVGEYVHQCLPGSQFVMLEATGHCPHLSSPGSVTKAIQEFL